MEKGDYSKLAIACFILIILTVVAPFLLADQILNIMPYSMMITLFTTLIVIETALSVVAIVSIQKSNKKGKWMAVVSLIIGIILILLTIFPPPRWDW